MKTCTKPVVSRRGNTFPPRLILAPLDFSECSDAGLAAAKALAERFGSRLELAHVDPGPPPALRQGVMGTELGASIAQYERRLRTRLLAAREGVKRVGTHMLVGDPERAVPRLAADAAADLVVMGTHGRRGLGRLVLGSVAEAAVHACRVPVLTTRTAPPARWPRRILAPYRMAPYADEALLLAVRWARYLGAELYVIFVEEYGGWKAVDKDEVCARAERLFGAGDPAPVWLWRDGRPYEQIVAAAQAKACDLVVIAAHSRGRLRDSLIGTTAERVLRCSAVPVLAVPS